MRNSSFVAMEVTFVDLIVSLSKQNKWREILKLKENDSNNILWAWPNEQNLCFIQKHLYENDCDGVSSIGCGCGLFEWLLQTSTGKK